MAANKAIYIYNNKRLHVSLGYKTPTIVFKNTAHFDNAFRYINHLIAEFNKIPKDNKKLLAEKLAEVLDNVNYLHPFREGSRRTQREFLRLLALEKGLTLTLNPPDNKSAYERYMSGTIESNVNTLTELILN